MSFEEMLYSVEERMLLLVEKPSTRVQACQLLAKSKGLRKEVEEVQRWGGDGRPAANEIPGAGPIRRRR